MAWVDICLGVVGLLFGREVPANIDATTPMPLQYARSLIVVGGSKVTAASCQASPGAEESMQVSIHTRVPPGRSYQPEFRFSVTGKHSLSSQSRVGMQYQFACHLSQPLEWRGLPEAEKVRCRASSMARHQSRGLVVFGDVR